MQSFRHVAEDDLLLLLNKKLLKELVELVEVTLSTDEAVVFNEGIDQDLKVVQAVRVVNSAQVRHPFNLHNRAGHAAVEGIYTVEHGPTGAGFLVVDWKHECVKSVHC